MGKKAVCYVNVGSIENGDFRPDHAQFTSDIVGKSYPGWDEKFIDIKSQKVRDIMLERFKRNKAAGCDAIEPDNTDVYTANTGNFAWPLILANEGTD
jgi:hypothetical protein